MTNEMQQWLEIEKRRIAQDKMALKNTKACAGMLRDARSKNLSPELCNEIFQLIRTSAIDEWGDGTMVDDFNDPPHFVIINGKKRERI